MARSRNIKPGFFKNETLAECSPVARLLFAGLWCLADRAGRLEDRPKRIRAEVLPYDDGCVDEMLDELHRAGFILRYQVGQQRFIQVKNFTKHQNPHCREPESIIPEPDKHGASTVLTPDEHETGPADSLLLIPDSLNLMSDADASVVAGKAADHCPHQEIIDLYHRILPMGRQVRLWTEARKAKLRARWREDAKRQSLDWWERLFSYVAKSDFLTGKICAKDRKPFEIDLEWIITSKNLVKIIEGKYDEGVES
jgi:hypothetical protein